MSKELILSQLQATVDTYPVLLSILHHILLVVVVVLLLIYKEKVKRLVDFYITLVFFSVFLASIAPIVNPFLIVVFGILTLLGIREFINPKMDYSMKDTPTIHIMIALVAGFIGFWYPETHFTKGSFSALYSSPLGVIPCPTLTVVLSLFLLAYPFTNRLFHWILSGVGLFFGFVGLFILGVKIDLALFLLALYSFYSLLLLEIRKPKQNVV